METMTKRKIGRPAKFTLLGVENGPIKAIGWAAKFPNQYKAYWNDRNRVKVEVVYNKKGNPYFKSKTK